MPMDDDDESCIWYIRIVLVLMPSDRLIRDSQHNIENKPKDLRMPSTQGKCPHVCDGMHITSLSLPWGMHLVQLTPQSIIITMAAPRFVDNSVCIGEITSDDFYICLWQISVLHGFYFAVAWLHTLWAIAAASLQQQHPTTSCELNDYILIAHWNLSTVWSSLYNTLAACSNSTEKLIWTHMIRWDLAELPVHAHFMWTLTIPARYSKRNGAFSFMVPWPTVPKMKMNIHIIAICKHYWLPLSAANFTYKYKSLHFTAGSVQSF